MKTLKFKVSIIGHMGENTKEKCYREIEATEDKTLAKLAQWIVKAFDFDLDHAYGFYNSLKLNYFDSDEKYELFSDMDSGVEPIGKGIPKSVEKTKISSVFTQLGQKMQFVFDYGDEWRFLVEYVETGTKEPNGRYPRVTKREGFPPPQYPIFDDDDYDYEDDEIIGINPVTGETLTYKK